MQIKKYLLMQFVVIFSFILAFTSPESLNAFQINGKDLANNAQETYLLSETQDTFYKVNIEKEISLDLKKATMAEALKAVSQKTGFKLTYRGIFGSDKKITIKNKNISVGKALSLILEGTNFDYKVSQEGYLLIHEVVKSNIDVFFQNVSGTVSDAGTGETLPGVNVVLKGTSTGTSTDSEGQYELDVPSLQDTLVFSFIGYQTQEVPINGRSQIDVELQSQAVTGEDVVVVGYGTQQRRDVTGSISSVTGQDISIQQVGNPVESLRGLATGVQIVQNSGQPGDDVNVLIRGPVSVLGSNDPLFVVDGFPIQGDLNTLNTNDIESIEVLKDASATSIYGSRASNGVVLVQTKRGNEGRTQVIYESFIGIQNTQKELDLLNATELAQLANLRARNDGMEPFFTESEVESFGKGFDWQDAIFRTAAIQNHSLRISGGNEQTTYNISGTLFNQDGIIINSNFDRIQSRINLDHKINPNVEVKLNGIFSRERFDNILSNNAERGLGVLSGALIAPPMIRPKDDDGNFNNLRRFPFTPDIAENPVQTAEERKDRTKEFYNRIDASVIVNLTEHFSFRSSIGVEKEFTENDFFSPSTFLQSATGSASKSIGESSNFVTENFLTYSTEFKKDHELELMGGFNFERNLEDFLSASSTDFVTDELQNFSLQSGNTPGTPVTDKQEFKIASFLSRINYSFRDKYLIAASTRVDGSSRFGNNDIWGAFPSGAIAWILSEEKFWSDIGAINFFKIRASAGETGNTGIDPFQSLLLLESSKVVFDSETNSSFAPTIIRSNPDLKWETTRTINFGFDMGLFNNRLDFNLELFGAKTSDLLINVRLPTSSGFTIIPGNFGKVRNRGIETSLNSNVIRSSDLMWDVGVNVSFVRNKALELPTGDIFADDIGNILPAMNFVREGEAIGSFFGFVEDGLTEDGQIKFKDFDGDGNPDRNIIGDPNPNFTFGINSSTSYRNFNLSVRIDGSVGNDILNTNLATVADAFAFGSNQIKEVLGNFWTEENPNPNAKFPKVSSNTRFEASDRFIEKGSFLTIRNVRLTYTLGDRVADFLPFRSTQFYINGQNLATFTGYSFFSPEVNTRGSGIERGIDFMGFPDARTITFGARINY